MSKNHKPTQEEIRRWKEEIARHEAEKPTAEVELEVDARIVAHVNKLTGKIVKVTVIPKPRNMKSPYFTPRGRELVLDFLEQKNNQTLRVDFPVLEGWSQIHAEYLAGVNQD